MQARVNLPMRSAWTRLSAVGMLVLLTLCAVAWAQQAPVVTTTPVGIGEPGGASPPAEPYVAEAVGNDVFIRSGPGTNFYQCGKLYAGDRVQVISVQLGWSCVVPPPGCFSWVSMQYVSINLDNPTMGIITGDNVGVYAGSDFMEPRWSTSKQAVLNRGQTVKLLGEEKDDYYKIAPPQGAYLWVSSQFLQTADRTVVKPLEANGATPVVSTPGEKPAPVDPNAPKTDLDLYHVLAGQIKALQTKPAGERDYAEIRAKLAELAAKKDAGRAARYAEYTLKQVDRFELAAKAGKELDQQKKALTQTAGKIDEARAAKLAGIDDLGKYAAIGTLQDSSVYANSPIKRYRLVDESGKTISYVTPKGAKATADCEKLIGEKVGLVGTIQPHEASGRAAIEFTEIVSLPAN